MSFLRRLFSRPAPGPSRPATAPGRPDDACAPELRIEAAVASDPGCVREVNEDCARIIRPDSPEQLARHGVLAVVCDGMGGHEAGEVASQLAVDTIARHVAADNGDPLAMLPRALQAANRAIFAAADATPARRGMGTTCIALLLRGGLAYGAHVGDSRLYLIRHGELFRMTEDHSAVAQLVRDGIISREEARRHPDRNVISRALGSHRDVQVTGWPQPFAVHPGDTFLLSSDGLHDLVGEAELLATAGGTHPQVACDRLVALARQAGGHDNISVAILAMRAAEDPDRPAPRATRAVEVPL